jgi:hypothetical protein
VDLGLCLLSQSNLSEEFWNDTFKHAVFLLNRRPTRTLQHKSPYLALFQKQPNYQDFKTFGCAVYPCLRSYNTQKLKPRSTICVFLGLTPNIKELNVLIL